MFIGEKELSLIFRGLPVNLKQTNLKEWLSPIRLKSVYLFRSSSETFAFVGFNRGTDLKKALSRTDQFLGGYKVSNLLTQQLFTLFLGPNLQIPSHFHSERHKRG